MLCQLSYAPGLRPEDCIGAPVGIPSRMSDDADEDRGGEDASDEELLDAQEGKGYGEDEGERDQALEEE